MITESNVLIASVKATAAIIKDQFVTYGGAQAGAGVAVAGVSGDNLASGEMIPVKTRGWIRVTAGAAIAQGAEVESDASGRAITRATGVSAGRAVDAATAAGQSIRIDR